MNTGRASRMAAVVGGGALVLSSASPASGNHDWGTNPDNASHGYSKYGLMTAFDMATDQQAVVLDAQTQMTVTSGDDVYFQEVWDTRNIYGSTFCTIDVAPPVGGRCDAFSVKYNRRTVDRDLFNSNNFKKLACHEFGHTAGLDEQASATYPNSCMRQGKLEHVTYDGHDVHLIDTDL